MVDVLRLVPRFASRYSDIEEVRIIDDHRLQVTCRRPSFYATPELLELQPMPAHIWGSDWNGQPVPDDQLSATFRNHWFASHLCGNGPYRLVESKGEYIRLERFSGYYGPRATCTF